MTIVKFCEMVDDTDLHVRTPTLYTQWDRAREERVMQILQHLKYYLFGNTFR